MTKPLLIMDQHFRKVEELFSPGAFAQLQMLCSIEGARNWPMAPEDLEAQLPDASFLVAATPSLTADQIDRAPKLKAVIEVSGAFHGGLDYAACFERGIEVLSCAPGFRHSVAEMGLAMILSGGRGLVAQHEAFRRAEERWLDDRAGLDFSLFGAKVGFVGYGNIARELHRLMTPFGPDVCAFDPWLSTFPDNVERRELRSVFETSRVVVVTAVPSSDAMGLVSQAEIEAMPPGSLLVLLSRALVVDFGAALKAARDGRITFATDVFPKEPTAQDDDMRALRNVILSPHRAAAVEGGRHPIGDMIVQDIAAMLDGSPSRTLAPADPKRVAALIEAQEEISRAGKLPAT